MKTTGKSKTPENVIEDAVYNALGGVIGASCALRCANGAIYSLLKYGKVSMWETAKKLEAATEAVGQKISALELVGEIAWQGPRPRCEEEPPKRRKGKTNQAFV